MKRALPIVLLLVLLTGCISSGETVKASEIKPLIDEITARHDAYVTTDLAATELQKRTWLRSSKILQETVNLAAEGGSE